MELPRRLRYELLLRAVSAPVAVADLEGRLLETTIGSSRDPGSPPVGVILAMDEHRLEPAP